MTLARFGFRIAAGSGDSVTSRIGSAIGSVIAMADLSSAATCCAPGAHAIASGARVCTSGDLFASLKTQKDGRRER